MSIPARQETRAPKAKAKAAMERLSRADWIEAATQMIAERNVDSLSVETLAKRLNMTKGSFYWHFKDREELLFAVIESWRKTMMDDIKGYLENSAGTQMGRLRRILRISISPRVDVPGGPFELSVRDYSRRDPRVADIIREVDESRIALLQSLYEAAGVETELAESYAFAHMAYVIGSRSLLFEGTREDINRRIKIARAFLIPEPSPGEHVPARVLLQDDEV
jgi:AcrR family transcriptional regulator